MMKRIGDIELDTVDIKVFSFCARVICCCILGEMGALAIVGLAVIAGAIWK